MHDWGAPRADFPEPLSPRLRTVVEALSADLENLTKRVVSMIWAAIPEYGLSRDPELRTELCHAIRINAELWYRTLLTATPPDEQALAPVIALARKRVHQGVPLASMLRAYRVGSRGEWQILLGAAGDDEALHQELLFKVSPYHMGHFDMVAQSMAMAYTMEQAQHARWRDRLRHELWSVISARPQDVEAFQRHAEGLGLDARAPHAAVVLRMLLTQEANPGLEDVIDKLLTRLARTFGVERESFMRALHRDHLVIWLPLRNGESLIEGDLRLAARASEALQQSSGLRAAAVGLPGVGAAGWRMSMEQAFRALEAGVASSAERSGARRYAEILLDDAVASSDNVRRFLDAMLERLAGEPQLLHTLETWLELRQHRKAVSSRLDVHPNTLDHRLQRIESLLGGRFDDVSWLALVHTALRLRRHGKLPDHAG